MTESINLKVKQGQKTQQKLVDIARRLFSAKGYAATTMQELINLAGITKGAVYHHFQSKQQLFEAVYINVEKEMAEHIRQASNQSASPFEQLLLGCFAYIESCSDPAHQQVLRIDGLAVLGLKKWRQIDQEFGVNKLIPFLQHLNETKVISVQSVEAFAHQLSGAMNEATFWIANHPTPLIALEDSKLMLQALLEGVRQQ